MICCKNHKDEQAGFQCIICKNYLCFQCVNKMEKGDSLLYTCQNCRGLCNKIGSSGESILSTDINKQPGWLNKIKGGFQLLKESFRILFRKPVMAIPIMFSWFVVAAVTLYYRYYFEPPSSAVEVILYTYFFIFVMALVVCLANTVMLEFVQQIESGERISFSKALEETMVTNLFNIIFVATGWAIIWLVIAILRAITSRGGGGKAEPSTRDAALTLGGANSNSSWFGLGLHMIEKLVRMVVFMILPAIAWQNCDPIEAFRKSKYIIKRHPIQFLTTYTLTEFSVMIMAIPLFIIFELDKYGCKFSSLFWTGVIIYEAVVWTLMCYLEQMSVGLLYLWHLKWFKSGSKGELTDVVMPDLLDDIYELQQGQKFR